MMLSTKNPTKPKGQMKKMVVIDGQYKKKRNLYYYSLSNESGHCDPKVPLIKTCFEKFQPNC